jgi:hypothetical protein
MFERGVGIQDNRDLLIFRRLALREEKTSLKKTKCTRDHPEFHAIVQREVVGRPTDGHDLPDYDLPGPSHALAALPGACAHLLILRCDPPFTSTAFATVCRCCRVNYN